jgi:CO dehydrogenase/acetyl-CoA synthase epsilon subunit
MHAIASLARSLFFHLALYDDLGVLEEIVARGLTDLQEFPHVKKLSIRETAEILASHTFGNPYT